jgi:hypothetical protein
LFVLIHCSQRGCIRSHRFLGRRRSA